MTIIQDEGKWHLESHLTTIADVVAGGLARFDIVMDRPGFFLGIAPSGSMTSSDLASVQATLNGDPAILTIGRRISNVAAEQVSCFALNNDSSTHDILFFVLLWVRDG